MLYSEWLTLDHVTREDLAAKHELVKKFPRKVFNQNGVAKVVSDGYDPEEIINIEMPKAEKPKKKKAGDAEGEEHGE